MKRIGVVLAFFLLVSALPACKSSQKGMPYSNYNAKRKKNKNCNCPTWKNDMSGMLYEVK
ncbi:MAG TPA: hypothetical protein VIK71_07685 [Flavobacteriales bacterium]|jgi:hypothetical protein